VLHMLSAAILIKCAKHLLKSLPLHSIGLISAKQISICRAWPVARDLACQNHHKQLTNTSFWLDLLACSRNTIFDDASAFCRTAAAILPRH
jgi:hypothetical protein